MPDSPLRSIPSVDRVLRDLGPLDLPRPAVVAVVRRELASLRAGDVNPPVNGGVTSQGVVSRIRQALDDLRRSRIQPVINGTGIIVHTNFGRSPLGPGVVAAMSEVAANYNNLEYDLSAGRRGGRADYLEHNLAVLCEAEAATVVNNCAAALVLVLRHFAKGERPEVVISRGELVQIGGGFRIPEILEASGATLREVGTTNKTSADDYARAIGPRTGMVLKVHRSNFFMGGFTESAPTEALAQVARQNGVPFVEDLGSGAMMATEELGTGTEKEHEPTPAEVLRQGADLVCFSGDKLLGGPQAGVIAGKRQHVAALKKEPFFRALRCDKLILSALQATVDLHLAGGGDGIPILEMMRLPCDELRGRAAQLVEQLAGAPVRASVGECESQIGGGSLPRTIIASVTLELLPQGTTLENFAARLRTPPAGVWPVVGYISGDRFKLDLRTIVPRQDGAVVSAIKAAAAS